VRCIKHTELSDRHPLIGLMVSLDQPLLNEAAPGQKDMSSVVSSPAVVHDQDSLMIEQESSPAYRALSESNLIENRYRVRRTAELDLIKANSTMGSNSTLQIVTGCGCCGCAMQFFAVKSGHIRKATHKDGRYLLYGEGVHSIATPFLFVEHYDVPLTTDHIIHGTKVIVTVQQGFVGLAMDRGQPLLLPPGLHQWDSPTLQFQKLIDLSDTVIKMGPYCLITVDEGYAAVTQDNGQQKILEGGSAYMLTHRNWKFEKFITKKLQTNDIGPLPVTSGDNVLLEVTATVNWLIENVQRAALMCANTMSGSSKSGPSGAEFDISKLRSDVLRQVTASIAAFVGSVQYSHAHVVEKVAGPTGKSSKEPEPEGGARSLFDPKELNNSVDHANEVCMTYGVKILTINLISAFPKDRKLLEALSQGAVASVEAQQVEINARGVAQATVLKAHAEAQAEQIRAEGDAAAEEIRAQGSLKAAKLVQTSDVAVTLAKLKTAGVCLGEGKANSFFFGLGCPNDIPTGILGNAALAGAANAVTQK